MLSVVPVQDLFLPLQTSTQQIVDDLYGIRGRQPRVIPGQIRDVPQPVDMTVTWSQGSTASVNQSTATETGGCVDTVADRSRQWSCFGAVKAYDL